MAEQFKVIWNNIIEFWGKLSLNIKKVIIGGLFGLIVIALVITLILNKKDYVVLFNNIDKEESAEVMRELQENKVDYKYEKDGTILIPKNQESLLRMQLAQSGHPRSGSNYDIFTQNIDFMTTDYEKKQYEIFQLQERLQASIQTINGVKEAIVTINLPDDKSFAWESDKKESSASVKLNLASGYSLTQSQTNGILQLVVKSVKGLKDENVAIIDTEGNSLLANSEMQYTNTIKLKLEIEKQFQVETEKDVTEFLAKIYGPENIKVSAKCTINFDKKISEILQYLPDDETKLGTPSETRNDKEVTGPGQTTGGVAGTETNAEMPTYPGVVIEGENIFFKDSNSIKYLVSELKEQIEHNPGKIEQLTVAAVINKASMKDEELKEIKELIAFSAGITTDNIALHNMIFYNPDAPSVPVGTTDVGVADNFNLKQILIFGGIGLAILAIIIFVISMILRKKKKKKGKQQAQDSTTEAAVTKDFSWADIHDEIKLKETPEQAIKKQLKEFSTANPEISAQLLRTWLKGDDD